MIFCRHCGKEMHEGAPSCPQCGAVQQAASQPILSSPVRGGALWLSIVSLICGILGVAAFFDDSGLNRDALVGIGILAVAGLALGVISLSQKRAGKGMAIAGLLLSSLALLALVGSL